MMDSLVIIADLRSDHLIFMEVGGGRKMFLGLDIFFVCAAILSFYFQTIQSV